MLEDGEIAGPRLVGADKRSARLDATTQAAKDIIDRERIARDAKTKRLRAARLAKAPEIRS